MRNTILIAILMVAIFSNYLSGALVDDPVTAFAVTAGLTVLAAIGLACLLDELQKALHGFARMEEN